MSLSRHTVLCGACKRPQDGIADLKPDNKVTCGGCGQEDRIEDITRIAVEYIGDCTAQALQQGMAKSVRSSKVLKFTPQRLPNRTFRWIVAGPEA